MKTAITFRGKLVLSVVITFYLLSAKVDARRIELNYRYHNVNRTRCSAMDTKVVQEEWEDIFSSRDGGVRRVILVNEMFRK